MMPDSDTTWSFSNGGFLTGSYNPAPGLVEWVDGMLVLLDPMQLLEDGDNAYEVDCTIGIAVEYQDINIYSSSKPLLKYSHKHHTISSPQPSSPLH